MGTMASWERETTFPMRSITTARTEAIFLSATATPNSFPRDRNQSTLPAFTSVLMQTLETKKLPGRRPASLPLLPGANWRLILLALVASVWVVSGCHKDIAAEASDSDANGYVCLKCGAKLYTARSVFIGPECPKCHQRSLLEVVGYACPKDNHLTVVAREGTQRGAPVCEACQGPVSGIRLPREKDLKA